MNQLSVTGKTGKRFITENYLYFVSLGQIFCFPVCVLSILMLWV